jgi:hypothetical protein
MAIGRGWHAASLLADGRVMVTGGEFRIPIAGGNWNVGTSTLAEFYDPLTNAWSAGPEMGGGRLAHTATLLVDGSLLVAGGLMETGQVPGLRADVLADVELSPAAVVPWVSATPLATGRYDHTATRLQDGSVLIVGGFGAVNGGLLRSVELYRPPRASAP